MLSLALLSFGSDSFEQLAVDSIEVGGECHRCIEALRINLETFSQFFCGRMVKERMSWSRFGRISSSLEF